MKKFYFLLFALLAIATGIHATDYGFKMLSYSITSDNYQSQSAGKAWYYDPAANVLHLKDGTISTTIPSTIIIEVNGDVNPSLKIQVDGNCSITGTFSVGIQFSGNGQHTICGNGTLTMKSTRTDPQVILSYGNTSLTIKDVTINIEAWGPAAVGLVSNRFYEVILDYCEMNIKTSGLAWAAIGGNAVSPVLKKCYLSNGAFSNNGTAYNNTDGNLKEAYIKRSVCVIDITVDEPVAGNEIPTDCTPNSTDYYVTSVEWHRSFDGEYFLMMPVGSSFNKGEFHRVYVMLYPTEGNRFANEKEDITAYVNGHEAKVERTDAGYVLISYTFPQLEFAKYDIWIGGKQVTEFNQEDVLGDGAVSYNPESLTLSINKEVTIRGNNTDPSFNQRLGCGIYSEIDGLTINVRGYGIVYGDEGGYEGIYLKGNTTIKGNSQLIASGYTAILMGINAHSLVVGGNVTLLAAGTDSGGLIGYMRTRPRVEYLSTLTVKDNATMRVMGAENGTSIGSWAEIILGEGFVVTTPAGATVGSHSIVDASGNDVKGQLVTIVNKSYIKGDVNGDKSVTIADGVAVLNAMAGQAVPGNPDVNNDGDVTIADFVAVLNIMAGQ